MGISDSNRPLRRIAAVHDLSCFGRCALTVILPVLSAMDFQAVPLPTALLSTHTGGYDLNDIRFTDLTDEMPGIADHFAKLGLGFDAVYTGFLGNARQIETVRNFIKRFKSEKTLVFVDPVMGDNGVLYSTYTKELMLGMEQLCRNADVITPNLTEACFLTGTEFTDTLHMSREEVFEFAGRLCGKLRGLGAGKIVITGIPHFENEFATYGYDTASDTGFIHSTHRISIDYPGTGDIFASVLLGKLLADHGFERSVCFAADFVCRVIEYSSHFDTPVRDGVAFEHFLGELTQKTEG